MMNLFRLVALVTLLTLAHSIPATARECEFDFYYQRLEEVVQVNNPSPQGWWEKTKSVAKGAWNTVASLWEKGVARNFFPGEGKKLWYSEKDHNIAYRVNRVKVRDEAHLLELMGAKGDESKLTDGQKGLLATYRASRSKAIQDLQKYSFRSKVKVLLTDTTGFEDAKKYPHVTSDFWAYSSGFMIQMASKRYGYANGATDAASTFLHEFAHTLDATLSEFSKPYGQDGSHYCNERTGKRAAFLEGFAEFNQMLVSADKAADIRNAVKTVMVEDAKKAGEYKYYQADGKELTGLDLTCVEGINATILYRLATEVSGGRDKVFAAFKNTNYPWRNLRHLLKDLVKNNPGDLAAIGRILDEETCHKLSDAEMEQFLGNSAAAKSFAAGRAVKNPVTTPSVVKKAPVDPSAVLTPTTIMGVNTGESSNPFGEPAGSASASAPLPPREE